jgi:hypothetical protein
VQHLNCIYTRPAPPTILIIKSLWFDPVRLRIPLSSISMDTHIRDVPRPLSSADVPPPHSSPDVPPLLPSPDPPLEWGKPNEISGPSFITRAVQFGSSLYGRFGSRRSRLDEQLELPHRGSLKLTIEYDNARVSTDPEIRTNLDPIDEGYTNLTAKGITSDRSVCQPRLINQPPGSRLQAPAAKHQRLRFFALLQVPKGQPLPFRVVGHSLVKFRLQNHELTVAFKQTKIRRRNIPWAWFPEFSPRTVPNKCAST